MDEFRHSQVTVGGSSVHVVEAGDPGGAPVLFLHGWPESWWSWRDVLSLAGADVRAIAVDLPGVGLSTGDATDGSKHQLAELVHRLVGVLGLRDVTVVGQDVGGMIAYAYLREYADVARVVIMDVVIPGVDPWDEVLRNPYIWHFALHSVPGLPERLVQGRQEDYFAFFFDALSHDPGRISAEARAVYASAYATDAALSAGFAWYRTFSQDASHNQRYAAGAPVSTPLLYLRGEHERGDIDAYVRGFHAAGVTNVVPALVSEAGHFTQEEAPAEVWGVIRGFMGR